VLVHVLGHHVEHIQLVVYHGLAHILDLAEHPADALGFIERDQTPLARQLDGCVGKDDRLFPVALDT